MKHFKLICCLMGMILALPGLIGAVAQEYSSRPMRIDSEDSTDTADSTSGQITTSPVNRNLQSSPDSDSVLHMHFRRVRDAEIVEFQYAVDQEEEIATAAVRLMDRQTAINWLTGFISLKPLSCPLKSREEWIDGILYAVEKNGLPLCKEILGLVASIISIESSFRSDPSVADASRGEDISALLDRAEKELIQKYGSWLSIPPAPQLFQKYKEKYYPLLILCQTEGEVESVARRIASDLKRDVSILPEFMKSFVNREIDKVTNVVRTKGSMQLNFPRARQVMKDRGDIFTDQELSDYMYTVRGGIDAGVAALKPMFVQYAARYGSAGDLSWLFFVGMDYNYGPFSSRNMIEQIRIRDLSSMMDLQIDGDLLQYDDKGNPSPKESETLRATSIAFPLIPKQKIFDSFLLEKEPHYIYSDIHRLILSEHTARFGPTPFAVIGELWMGENSKIKHGVTFRTRTYLNKLDKYLNAVPWDQ
ncbi:MAG: DUF1615 family protein [Pseudomonadota bacterium]